MIVATVLAMTEILTLLLLHLPLLRLLLLLATTTKTTANTTLLRLLLRTIMMVVTKLLIANRLFGLVVKAPTPRPEDLGFDSRLRSGDFSRSSHISDSKTGTPVATLCPVGWA